MKVKANTEGFTLVEVLVALAIVGLALPAMLFFVGGVADNTAYLRDKTVAQWIAANRYAEASLIRRLKGELLKGTSDGSVEMVNGEWRWLIDSHESNVEGIQQLDISVYRDKTGNITEDDAPLVTLQGLLEQ